MYTKRMSIQHFFTSRRLFWWLFVFIAINWLGYAIIEYLSCGFATWDTGAHIQPVIHWALYGEYADKLLLVNHPFLNHFRPALLLLAPIVNIFPTMLVIHIAKIMAFLLVPLQFLHYGKKYKLKLWAYALPILWLLHDVLMTVMFAENQATTLTLPLIVWAFFCAYEKKYRTMLIPCVAMIFFKEIMPIIWVCLGLFIWVEQRQTRWAVGLICAGIIVGLTIYLGVIPWFGQGQANHQQEGLAPLDFLGLKLGMLIRAYLSMGFFVIVWPRVLIYTLPLYSVYLLGGYGVYRAFFLGSHNHDFTTTFLFCCGFYVLKQTLEGKSLFNPQLKWQRQLVKTVVVILCIIGVSKLPIIRVLTEPGKIVAGYHTANAAKQLRAQLNPQFKLFVTPALLDYFIDFRHIRSLDNKHYKTILTQDGPFYIIMPSDSRLYKMRKDVVQEYKSIITQHAQQQWCSVTTVQQHADYSVVLAKYTQGVPMAEKKRLATLFARF